MPRVLLVEDYADARDMYAAYLEGEGFEVVQAGDGIQALQRATSTQVDVIVLDFNLPHVDGLEIARRLRANPATSRTPIVMLSASGTEEYAAQALAAGANMALSKPCTLEGLFTAILAALAATPPDSAPAPPTD